MNYDRKMTKKINKGYNGPFEFWIKHIDLNAKKKKKCNEEFDIDIKLKVVINGFP
jgi:hypothetical protein